MIYYLDSSVLVKRFVREAGSPRIRQLMRGRGRLAASSLANVEIRSAIARLTREGVLDEAEAKRALSHLDGLWPSLTIVEARGRTLELAGELVRKHPLRAYDAVHLASALRLRESGAVTFGCADAGLRKAAIAESLRALPL